ncbi:MAG: signal recognition particle receptor subunit alpha, partial [Candidatus Methylomirabilales bacterium]
MNLFSRFKEGLKKTREGFAAKLDQLLGRKLDPATFEELEELLLSSDVGPSATKLLLNAIQEILGRKELRDPDEVKRALKERIVAILQTADRRPPTADRGLQERPHIILFLGVNGSGKTTTIAKLAKRYLEGGEKVLLAAADTFRAAAIDQLLLLGKRVGAEVIAHKAGADPAAVVFDALKAAQARGIDHLLIDTAGRLHTKRNLMEELKKIRRIIAREIPSAP